MPRPCLNLSLALLIANGMLLDNKIVVHSTLVVFATSLITLRLRPLLKLDLTPERSLLHDRRQDQPPQEDHDLHRLHQQDDHLHLALKMKVDVHVIVMTVPR